TARIQRDVPLQYLPTGFKFGDVYLDAGRGRTHRAFELGEEAIERTNLIAHESANRSDTLKSIHTDVGAVCVAAGVVRAVQVDVFPGRTSTQAVFEPCRRL